MDESKTKYLEQLTGVLTECLSDAEDLHALLIVADDKTQTLKLYSVNAHEEMLPPLLMAAAQIVTAQGDMESMNKRTIN